MNQEQNSMKILEQLEQGKIDMQEAERLLNSGSLPQDPRSPDPAPDPKPPRTAELWLIPFAIGFAGIVTGAWLAALGGWWWLCAGPLLLVGILAVTIASLSQRSAWIHVQVNMRQDRWPRRISLHLPVPVRFASRVVRVFRPHIGGLQDTGVDELLMALEDELSPETPLWVQVDEGENGERIEVTFG
jgi:hypothetical protein